MNVSSLYIYLKKLLSTIVYQTCLKPSTMSPNVIIAYSRRKKTREIFLCQLIFSTVFDSKCTICSPSLTLQIVLPPHLDNIRDKLAENIHELWGMNKIELGWTYGKVNQLTTFKL